MLDDTDAARGRALEVIGTLAGDIGPRRPTGLAEARAAKRVAAWLAEAGLDPVLETFRGPTTFAWAQAVAPALALLGRPGSPHPASRALGALALVAGATEGDPRLQPLTRLTSAGESRNGVARIEPAGEALRTLCLVCHLDSSRSGLLFHPRFAPRLRSLIAATSIALVARSLALVAGGRRGWAKPVGRASGSMLAVGLALLAERELRGRDVPGANDNASGAAVTAALAAEVAGAPLDSTRLVLLVTGAEEAGTLGADAFVRSRDTGGWLFLNFDGVCARATLRYLAYEGIVRTWPADPGLIALAESVRDRRPELGLEPMDTPAGLTYDATPILARGGRALTISAQDAGTIPNYHRPTDDAANVDRDTVGRALEIGRELIAAIDRGEAD